ncbi:MAG: hypothetical protein VB081_12995 [Christensenella sp.]|uniref:hypothetical protein n=1 Tax=Christensenella sp. TaxID=1935934 RepID=UPI002B21309B|nr:hypothetical protein [Christensenella sp.]MEA5004395.1 hypothetical protein [Christensenella sp.]
MSKINFEEAYSKFGIKSTPIQKNYSPELHGASIKRCSVLKQGNVSYDYKSCFNPDCKKEGL